MRAIAGEGADGMEANYHFAGGSKRICEPRRSSYCRPRAVTVLVADRGRVARPTIPLTTAACGARLQRSGLTAAGDTRRADPGG
jgi:hypothetical protein